MHIYNIMTCEGFGNSTIDQATGKVLSYGRECAMPFYSIWVGLMILAILFMLAKKWLGEEESVGMPYNWLYSFAGIVVYIIVAAFTGSFKWSFLIGFVAMLLAGFGTGGLGGGE